MIKNDIDNYIYPNPYHKADLHYVYNNESFTSYSNGYGIRRRGLEMSQSISPLFLGYGTHYAFLWVGSPPQRKSVIIDTGSHNTAFPCVGCKCGKHVSFI